MNARSIVTRWFILALWLCVFSGLDMLAQNTDSSANKWVGPELELHIPASETWTDTALELRPGDVLQFHVMREQNRTMGTVQPVCDPRGVSQQATLGRDLPVSSIGLGALIAKFAPGFAQAHAVGQEVSYEITAKGRLFLGINTDGDTFCRGYFDVRLRLSSAGEEPNSNVLEVLLNRLPRTIQDAQGHQGDMINLAFVGQRSDLLQHLAQTNWVVVDRKKSNAIVNAILDTYSQQSYLEMPMSDLYLFGRPQDYGFTMAQAYKVVASRHHFRIWLSPFIAAGKPVWIGAGTHDIGFEKDRRSGQLTHKIDPEIDKERDYISESLTGAGQDVTHIYFLPRVPFTSGKNATGGSIVSDGRIAILTINAGQISRIGSSMGK